MNEILAGLVWFFTPDEPILFIGCFTCGIIGEIFGYIIGYSDAKCKAIKDRIKKIEDRK